MKLAKYLTSDKDRSIFFTCITVLCSAAAVIAVSNEQYSLTAMSAGGAVVGLVGLLWKAVAELVAPVIRTAQSITGRFRKFDATTHTRAYHN